MKAKCLKNTGVSYLSKREQDVITRPENIHNNPLKSTENKQNNNNDDDKKTNTL